MKIYRLKSWPDLPVEFRRMPYRRLLTDLSHRHIGERDMRAHSGLSSAEVRALLLHLGAQGLLDITEAPDPEAPLPARRLAWLAHPWQLLRRAG